MPSDDALRRAQELIGEIFPGSGWQGAPDRLTKRVATLIDAVKQEEATELREEATELREALAATMTRLSLATGHGDTHADLLAALQREVENSRKQAEQRGREQMDSQRASEADCLNTELRQNYRSYAQVKPEDDWREAFQELVNGACHAARFRAESEFRTEDAQADTAPDDPMPSDDALRELADKLEACHQQACNALRQAAKAEQRGEQGCMECLNVPGKYRSWCKRCWTGIEAEIKRRGARAERERLKMWTHHIGACPVKPCDCGLTAALDAAPEGVARRQSCPECLSHHQSNRIVRRHSPHDEKRPCEDLWHDAAPEGE